MNKNLTTKDIKEIIRIYISLNGEIHSHAFGEDRERMFRRAVSELRKEGLILIPTEPRIYTDVKKANRDQVKAYAKRQASHMARQYFNTLKPIQEYLKDQNLTDLMGNLEEAWSKFEGWAEGGEEA